MHAAFMGSLKTSLLSLILAGANALPAHAFEQQPLELFATCAGQLSAQLEFQWLLNNPEAEVTEARRKGVLDLLEAVLEPGQERYALATRISAKQAHAALLTRATFNENADDAAWAATLASDQQAICASLLLG